MNIENHISFLNYFFVLFFVFNLLKVNYFNPIVGFFVKLYKPISKIFKVFRLQAINILILAVLVKFLSLLAFFNEGYSVSIIFAVSLIQTTLVFVNIIFYSVIVGVILSWVAPNTENVLLQLIQEISYKSLYPISKYLPSAGGLDFSPLFLLIFINLARIFLYGLEASII